jgi:ribonuclease HII
VYDYISQQEIGMTANDSEEAKLIQEGFKYVAGVDESGMGSMAGDLYVAAVIFPPGIDFKLLLPGLNDSKQKKPEQRKRLYDLIKKYALTYSVQIATVSEVNEHNVYWARFIAARRALDDLQIKPSYVLMDGNADIPGIDIPQAALVKGDSKSISIAAASILAKVERDEYMEKLAAKVHEDYGWISNKAYYSKKHIDALKKHGKTEWHRDRFLRKFEVGGSSEKVL